MPTYTTVDEYIAQQPEAVQPLLHQVRAAIREAAPQAAEKISYGMPTYTLHGNLVHFAAWKQHIGFYPAPSGLVQFQEQLARYKGSKGSVHFPLDEPMPIKLIKEITKYRVKESTEMALAKKKGNR